MGISNFDLVRHFESNERHALEVIEWYQQLEDDVNQRLERTRQQEAEARKALALAYLPELSHAAIDRAQTLTGFRGFARRDPIKALQHETATLQRTIARVEADERYQRRQFLVGPHGEWTRKRQETEEMLAPWREEAAKFESLEGFEALVDLGYDTPAYSVSWVSTRYWRYWAQGDAICEALGMADFGDDVLPAYNKVAAERARWQAVLDEQRARIDEVHELVRTRDQAELRIPRLPELYFESALDMLCEFLEQADLPLLEEWSSRDAGDDRPIQMALRRVAGLQAKLRYLREVQQDGVAPALQQMRERRSKYHRKASKYARNKYYGQHFPESTQDLKFQRKLQKYEQNIEKMRRLLDRMERYEDYHRFSLANDPDLWWLEMTGKNPSRFTPRLRGYYERNPSLSVRHDVLDERAAVAAAASAAAEEDWGYLS